ncbi:MAG: pilin [Patescibacteria group bacterium]
MKNRFKKYLFILLLVELMLSYIPTQVFAAEQFNYASSGVSKQIEAYLCAPSKVNENQTNLGTGAGQRLQDGGYQNYAAANNANSGDLFKCINQLYRFAIILSAVIGVFFIVIAGYIYMSAEGNQESVDKAKNILVTTITSMVILMAGYLLLKAINPDLIQFKSIQPPSVQMNTTAWQEWQASKGLEGTGGGPDTLVGATGTNGCTNCADYTKAPYNLPGNPSQKSGSNTFLNQTLLTKLQQVKATYPYLLINEAFPPTVKHSSPCHYNGTCVDVGGTNGSTAAELDKICKAAKVAGLDILNEYANHKAADFKVCPAPKTYSPTTGGHLHLY